MEIPNHKHLKILLKYSACVNVFTFLFVVNYHYNFQFHIQYIRFLWFPLPLFSSFYISLFLLLSVTLLSSLLLAGVQWLPWGGVCLCHRVYWHQSTYMDLYARACSLCSRCNGSGSDWLPDKGLVDLPDHPLCMHLTLLALLLEVP